MAEAKGKIRRRHAEAILVYKDWLQRHPKATLKRRISEFDAIVDSAALAVEIQRNLRREKISAK